MSSFKTVIIAICCFGWMACISGEEKARGPLAPGYSNPAEVADPSSLTTVQWLDSVVNSGTIVEGQKLEVSFRFKNTGDKPLVIESANPSCGCTVPAKPEKPIMPGGQGEINAVFNSEGRSGANHKTITIQANTKPNQTHIVEFNVNVVGKKEGPRPASPSPQQF